MFRPRFFQVAQPKILTSFPLAFFRPPSITIRRASSTVQQVTRSFCESEVPGCSFVREKLTVSPLTLPVLAWIDWTINGCGRRSDADIPCMDTSSNELSSASRRWPNPVVDVQRRCMPESPICTGRASAKHGKRKPVWEGWNSANSSGCVVLPRHTNLN